MVILSGYEGNQKRTMIYMVTGCFLITTIFGRISYVYWGKRYFYRRTNYSPMFLRLKASINRTFLGKLNLLSHVAFNRFREKYLIDIIAYRYNNPFFYRANKLFFGFLYGCAVAYIVNELFARNGSNRFFESISQFGQRDLNFDISYKYIDYAKDKNLANEVLKKDLDYKLSLLSGIKDKKLLKNINPYEDGGEINYYGKIINSTDIDYIVRDIDFLQYGKLMSSLAQEEIATECYYIAYLKNRKIKANSELKFDTKI